MSSYPAVHGLSYPFAHEAETQLLRRVVNLLRLCGFLLIYHTYDSRRSEAGFPDIVAVGHGRCLFIELKSDEAPRRLPLAQEAWKAGLEACAGVEYYCWRPRDWQAIERTLTRRF